MITIDCVIRCSVTGQRASTYMVATLSNTGIPSGWKVKVPEGWTLEPDGDPVSPEGQIVVANQPADAQVGFQEAKDRATARGTEWDARKPVVF